MHTPILDAWQCRRTVRRWRRRQHTAAQWAQRAARLRRLPGWRQTGDFLYAVGFLVEYTAVCAARRLAVLGRLLGLALAGAVVFLLRPLTGAVGAMAAAAAAPGWRPHPLRWLAPGAAALLLAAVVHTGLHLPFVLRVEVNGATVGYVASEQAFETARAEVQARLNASLGSAAPLDLDPGYTLAVSGETMTENEIANAILRAGGGEITEGTAVYIDGALRFVTTEGDHLRSFLAAAKAPWQAAAAPGDVVSFLHEVRLVDGVYLADSVTPQAEVMAALQAADGADGTVPELLKIKTVRQETTQEAIPFESIKQESADLDYGTQQTVQTGADGLQAVTRRTTYVDGAVTEVQVVGVTVLQPATAQITVTGTRLKNGMVGRIGSGTFVWPVPQYTGVTRWMSATHLGTDIAAPYGTPIVASDAGTVVTATWHNHPTASYGYYIVIDHGNGYRTLYAHMSSFAVQQGDTVEQGQVIGYVGSTGYSFGNHCHFEMYGPEGRFSAQVVFPDM